MVTPAVHGILYDLALHDSKKEWKNGDDRRGDSVRVYLVFVDSVFIFDFVLFPGLLLRRLIGQTLCILELVGTCTGNRSVIPVDLSHRLGFRYPLYDLFASSGLFSCLTWIGFRKFSIF